MLKELWLQQLLLCLEETKYSRVKTAQRFLSHSNPLAVVELEEFIKTERSSNANGLLKLLKETSNVGVIKELFPELNHPSTKEFEARVADLTMKKGEGFILKLVDVLGIQSDIRRICISQAGALKIQAPYRHLSLHPGREALLGYSNILDSSQERYVDLHNMFTNLLLLLGLWKYPASPLLHNLDFLSIACQIWNEIPRKYLEDRDAVGRTILHIVAERSLNQWPRRLIELGVSVHAQDSYGRTPLHIACLNANESLVSILLETFTIIDCPMHGGATPLHLAVLTGNIPIINMLLRRNADPNLKLSCSMTSLGLAIAQDNLDIVRLLCESQANVLSSQDPYPTAVAYAAKRGNILVLKAVLSAAPGLDHNKLTQALGFAVLHSSTDAVKHLCERGSLANCSATQRHEIAQLALQSGALESTEIILGHCVDVISYIEPSSGQTLLHSAVLFGQVNKIEPLVRYGAHLDATDNIGLTPLYLAASLNAVEAVSELVRLGANVNNGQEKHPSLVLSVIETQGDERKMISTLSVLLSKGADTDAQDSYGKTALHIAAQLGWKPIAELLLQYGARMNIMSHENQTAWAIMKCNGWTDLIGRVREVGFGQA